MSILFNIILHSISFSLFIIAFYGLYLLSEKQIKFTTQRWHYLTQHIKRHRIFCFILIFIASSILILNYHSISIGIVATFIFLTPLILILILFLNLKHRGK